MLADLTEEGAQFKRSTLESRVIKYFQNKQIVSEKNEECRMLFDEIEDLYDQLGTDEEIVVALPNGTYVVLIPEPFEKEVLDKDSLADEMQVAKDELKTPFDYCAFTAKGKLTPAMITKHTSMDRGIKLKIKKKKKPGKRRKKQ